MNMSKMIMPLVATAVLGYVVKKGKFPVKSSRAVSDIAQVASDATINAEKGSVAKISKLR